MFATPAFAQTAASAPAAAPAGGFAELLAGPLPLLIVLMGLMYFMVLRPQQRRAKSHQEMVKAVKRGDTVVLSSGVIAKVAKVEDAELQVEIAPTVTARVVRTMVSEVRPAGSPAPANDVPAKGALAKAAPAAGKAGGRGRDAKPKSGAEL